MADERLSPITFPLYYDRWIAATRHLSAAARGVYVDWLGWSWMRGRPLPLDKATRARIAAITTAEIDALWPELAEFWRETPDGYVNDSLERKRKEAADYHASQREKGRRGAAVRWGKDGPAIGPAIGPANSPSNGPRMASDLGSRSSDLDLRFSDLDVAKNGDPDPVKIEDQPRSSSSAPALSANGSWVEPHGNPHAAPTNLINGSEQRRHGQHAWCADTRPNLCVPLSLHAEILGASQKPEAVVKAWYADTIAKFNGQPIGDDRFVFWRNELAAWIGTVTAPPSKKPFLNLKARRAAYEARKNAKQS